MTADLIAGFSRYDIFETACQYNLKVFNGISGNFADLIVYFVYLTAVLSERKFLQNTLFCNVICK